MSSITLDPIYVLEGILTNKGITISETIIDKHDFYGSLTFTEKPILANTVFVYKGTVANIGELPGDPMNGDVYYDEDTGTNYAWMGEQWQDIGSATVYEELTEGEKAQLIGLLN